MKINKQLFEDVLAGTLKGTFVLRGGRKCNSDELSRCKSDGCNNTYLYCLNEYSYTQFGYYFDSNRMKSNVDIIDFIPDTDMKQNELTIEIPEGKIVDWDESKKRNRIVFKDEQLTYDDICEKLFKDDHYIIAYGGQTIKVCSAIYNASNATTEHQLECILAKNKLANVAIYLNDGWKPNKGDHVFYLTCYLTCCEDSENKHHIHVGEYYFGSGENLVLFKTEKVAQQAIKILGEETIKLALEPLGV